MFLSAACVLATAPAAAQVAVTSSAPESLDVTIYRDPDRDSEELSLEWLRGYALITERRTINLPAGKAIIRFEGVAGGMLPESAILLGLPGGVREKNLDADLLSPASLYASAFGRPVILRRQHAGTGEVREEPAIVRSGPAGSVIVQTRAGFEVADCGPLQDSLVYDGVPPGLSTKPTLSIEVDSPKAARATVTLSYLAWGFDWLTNYVVHMKPDGRHADILAWVTLASSDPISFADARAAVVGGQLNREDRADRRDPQGERLTYRCYLNPYGTAPSAALEYYGLVEEGGGEGDIVVTGARRSNSLMDMPEAMVASEEGLGDLKLYRLPVPTTIASNAQKQVAMFVKPNVRLAIYYQASIDFDDSEDTPSVKRMLRMKNAKSDGLGIAMPAGRLAVFEPYDGRPVLAGEGTLVDSALAENVLVELGDATQVTIRQEEVAESAPDDTQEWEDHEVAVRNAHPWPVDFEGLISMDDEDLRIDRTSTKLGKRYGKPVWKVRVPANGAARLRYRLIRID